MNFAITVFLIRVQSCGIGDNKLNLIITKLYFYYTLEGRFILSIEKSIIECQNMLALGGHPLPLLLNAVVYLLYTAKQMIKWLLVNHK
jgi:hypothetical protein